MTIEVSDGTNASESFRWRAATVSFALLLAAFAAAAQHFDIRARIAGHFPSAFVSFALLLAPFWFFGFGLAGALVRQFRARTLRGLAPGLLVVPYIVFALPRGEMKPLYALVFIATPIALAALMEFAPPSNTLAWQDVIALLAIGLPVEFRWLGDSFPHSGLSAMPKLLLVDAALYAYLVVRKLPRVGFDFLARGRDFLVGLREFAIYAPIAIGLGLALGFLHPNFHARSVAETAGAYLITFFFVAIPEELFFRGLLQNLLENRIGRVRALIVTACIFGLSHFNKPLPFNWRYVLMAAIAGIFYGRAWLDRRRLTCSAITHTTVDVVWSLWWR
jgi:membrane protease YdiL (CAAX protease family)